VKNGVARVGVGKMPLESIEDGFLNELNDDDLRAVIAHELGHIWILTHHPYLQTEQLANKIAMRLVTRESLVTAYGKVWERTGTKGDPGAVLGQDGWPTLRDPPLPARPQAVRVARGAAEPLEGTDQPFIGVLGVLGLRAPEMEAARVAQGIHDDVDGRGLAGDHGALGSPNRSGAAARDPSQTGLSTRWAAVHAWDGGSRARWRSLPHTLRLELPPDPHRVPDPIRHE
jgi:Peptidase family M48